MSVPVSKLPAPPADRAASLPLEAPRAPTAEAWATMTAAEQARAEAALIASESREELDERDAMAEGDPHIDAKMDARDTLRAYFARRGRRMYVGAEIKVFYPGEKGFTPDVIAVADVDQHPRNCWMVSREGKGVDLALEVHYEGDWRKDFVDNVAKYASLGIHEYFIYDVRRGQVRGHRLPRSGPVSYEVIPSRAGKYRSDVLDLELAVEGGRLRFYLGTAELITATEMVDKLERMVEAAAAQSEQEQLRVGQEQLRAEQALSQVGQAILAILKVRGLPVERDAEARILGTTDLTMLQRWLQRAVTIAAAEELFLDA